LAHRNLTSCQCETSMTERPSPLGEVRRAARRIDERVLGADQNTVNVAAGKRLSAKGGAGIFREEICP
jgi:hypothetical protein